MQTQQGNVMQYNNPQSTSYQQSQPMQRVTYQNPQLNPYENNRMPSNPMPSTVYPNQMHGSYGHVSQPYSNTLPSNLPGSYYPPNRPIGYTNPTYTNYGGNTNYNQSYPSYQQHQQNPYRMQVPSFLSPEQGAMYI